jgi:hypothetical protein
VRRLVIDGLWSLSALVLLLLALTFLDPRVRDELSWRAARQPGEELLDASTRMRNVATVTYRAARDQAEEHTALMFFAVAGGVLLVFMLRT